MLVYVLTNFTFLGYTLCTEEIDRAAGSIAQLSDFNTLIVTMVACLTEWERRKGHQSKFTQIDTHLKRLQPSDI